MKIRLKKKSLNQVDKTIIFRFNNLEEINLNSE